MFTEEDVIKLEELKKELIEKEDKEKLEDENLKAYLEIFDEKV